MIKINLAPGDVQRFNKWAAGWAKGRSDDWATFGDKHGQVKRQLNKYLRQVQHRLSAYTEQPFTDKIHIDHFRKRNLFPRLTMDMANYVLDNHVVNYGADFKDRFHLTSSDYNNIIDPHQDALSNYIEYNMRGEIIFTTVDPNMLVKVKRTCEVFNLNNASLLRQRKKIIEYVKDFKQGGLPDDEIRDALNDGGFPSVVEWALKNVTKSC